MITTSVIVDFTEIDALQEFVAAFPELALEEINNAFQREIVPPFLNELQYVPPNQPDLPFVWSEDPRKNARARAWYFANRVPKGSRGGRYQRTGELVKAWRVDVTVGDGAVVLSASNKARAVRYVTGSRQVPSHRATGWVPHLETIRFWSDAAREVIPDALRRVINGR